MSIEDPRPADDNVSQRSLLLDSGDTVSNADAHKLENSPGEKLRPENEWIQILHAASTIIAALLPVVLGVYSQAFGEGIGQTACLPGGNFALPGTASIWSAQSILSITIGFGSFDFANAKAIDLCWDVVLGRGGQALLAWLSYRVFSNAIVFAMNTMEISCDTYAAVAFNSGSGYETWTVFLDFIRGRFPKTRYGISTYLAMLVVGTYILAFPTLLSAMTSYGAISTPVVQHGNSSTSLSLFTQCQAIVRDGSRVGLNDGYVIDSHANDAKQPTAGLLEYWHIHSELYRSWETNITDNPTEFFLDGRSSGTQNMSLASVVNLNGTIQVIGPPLLNVINFTTALPHLTCWHYDDVVVTDRDLLGEGSKTVTASCNISLKYKWGFSYLLLFITAVVNAVVAITLYSLHTYTFQHSRHQNTSLHQPQIWRAIVNLAKEIHIAAEGREHDVDNDHLKGSMESKSMTLRPSASLPSDRTVASWDPQFQVVLLALICLLSTGMYHPLSAIDGSPSHLHSYFGGRAYFVTLSTVGFITGLFVNRLGAKPALFFGTLGCSTYIFTYLFDTKIIAPGHIILAEILPGLCTGLVWSAQGQIMMSYPSEASKGRYIGCFFGVYNIGGVIQGLMPLSQNVYNEGPYVPTAAIYSTFLALSLAAPCLILTMENPRDIVRSDGSHIPLMRSPTWKSELVGLWKSLSCGLYILCLFPMIFVSGWIYVYQAVIFKSFLFNTRTQGLNSTLFWVAQIVGALTFGFGLDYQRTCRNTRALLCWSMLLVLTIGIWGGGYAFQKKYTSDDILDLAKPVDWTSSNYIGPMLLCMCYGFYDAAWKVTIFWYMGALTNNGRKLANYAGFYQGVQTAGVTVIILNHFIYPPPFMPLFASCWALCVVSLLFALPVVLWKIKDTIPLEEDLKFNGEAEKYSLP